MLEGQLQAAMQQVQVLITEHQRLHGINLKLEITLLTFDHVPASPRLHLGLAAADLLTSLHQLGGMQHNSPAVADLLPVRTAEPPTGPAQLQQGMPTAADESD